MRYSIGLDGVPYLHTPNLPRFALGPPGDYDQARLRIRQHQERVTNGTLDWRVDWPDRLITRLKSGTTWVWRCVRIDQTTGKRGRPTIHPSKAEALK